MVVACRPHKKAEAVKNARNPECFITNYFGLGIFYKSDSKISVRHSGRFPHRTVRPACPASLHGLPCISGNRPDSALPMGNYDLILEPA